MDRQDNDKPEEQPSNRRSEKPRLDFGWDYRGVAEASLRKLRDSGRINDTALEFERRIQAR
jgi:hypothetical protein